MGQVCANTSKGTVISVVGAELGVGKDSDQWVWRSPCPGVWGHCYSLWTLLRMKPLSSSNTCSLSTCHMVGKVLEVEEETLNRSDQAPVLLEMMSWWTRPMVIK